MSAFLLLLCPIQAPPAAQEGTSPLPEPGGFLKEVRTHLRSDRLLLSQYAYTQKVTDRQIWLPAEARFAGTARFLLLKGLRLESISEFSDYRKFSVFASVSFPDRKKP